MATFNTAVEVGSTKADLDVNSTRLSRLFTTVKETFEPVKADVTGTMPSWLKGDLVRTGPGMYEVNGQKYNHLFDGMSILHKFSIDGGSVTYQSKYLRSDTFKKNMSKQRIAVGEFGTVASPDPCDSMYKRFFARFKQPPIGDNCNVNILPFANDELYVATETPTLRKFDLNSLDTLGKFDFSQLIAVNLATAHPHFDSDGTAYNIGTSYVGGPKYHVVKIPPSDASPNGKPCAYDKAYLLSTIPGQFRVCPCYYHSFAMTANYIVLMEQPFYMNVSKLLFKQVFGRPPVEGFQFSDEYPTRIHVVNKDTGEIHTQTYTSPPQIVFHHINAYEDDDQIVMDVVDIVDDVVGEATLDIIRRNDGFTSSSEPRRFVIPLYVPEGAKPGDNVASIGNTATAILQEDGSIHCTSELLCTPGCDLPTINYKQFNGKKYRYFYGTGLYIKGPYENRAMKCDVTTNEVKTWAASETSYVSEPIFIPTPGGVDEDDGVVLCGVSDVNPREPDYLVVLDGKTFEELARASVPDDVRIPYGFHGQFI